MKNLLILLVIPCLVTSDIQCPETSISCPDDKKCCEVNGQTTCCDLDDDVDAHIIEGKMKVYAGEPLIEPAEQYPNSTVQHGLLTGRCNLLSCGGMCCKDFCCAPGYSFTCCPGNTKCCPPKTRCCQVGCCGKKEECCGTGCCLENQRCCGSWCCKKKAQCGATLGTCYGKGATFTPTVATILLLAAAVMISRHS